MPEELTVIIETTPCGADTFLMNDYGRPFSQKGFGNRMRKWCDAAGLPQCSALRKRTASDMAEGGATEAQMNAALWSPGSKMAGTYIKRADKARPAASGQSVLKVSRQSVPKKERPDLWALPKPDGRSGGTRTPNPRFWRPVL
jgi:hypothetical protein